MATGFRIIIVDDEIDIRDSLAQLLEVAMPGAQVDLAKDGIEALAMIKKQPPDLIVSDYKMPGIDGVTFLKQAKELMPDVPRLLISAYPDANLAARAVRDAGVGLFIAKPFNPEYLVDVLQAFDRPPPQGQP